MNSMLSVVQTLIVASNDVLTFHLLLCRQSLEKSWTLEHHLNFKSVQHRYCKLSSAFRFGLQHENSSTYISGEEVEYFV